ncbi:MAG: hypothetical protein WC994_02445 [Brumimicrobium sp.]
MNTELAKFYFPATSEDDLFVLWEDQFFQQKQFFLTNTPNRTVWESKLRRLQKTYTAFLVLTDQPEENKYESMLNTSFKEFTNNFIEAFNEFHTTRNIYKTKVIQSNTVKDLHNTIMEWLSYENHFYLLWFYEDSMGNELQVLRGKEPDPMYILADLKQVYNEFGFETFDDLKTNYNKLPLSLQKEVKRLTLLAKNNYAQKI